MSARKHWTHYLFLAYLALLVWLPLPLSSKPLWSMIFFNLLMASLSLAAVIGCHRSHHSLPPVFARARLPMAAFALYCLWLQIQNVTGWSINSFRSQQQFLLTLSYVQLFALTLFLVDTRERLRLLLLVLVGSGVFQALYGGLMTLSGVEKIWWIRKMDHLHVATGTFTNRNQLANYLVMCLSAGCGLLIAAQQGQRINSWRQFLRRTVEWLLSGSGWLRLLLASIVIGIVLTHSRMGNISLFVSLTVTGLLWLWSIRSSWKRAAILIGSLLLIDTLIVGTWFGLDEVVERLQATQTANTEKLIAGDSSDDTESEETAPAQPAHNNPQPRNERELRDTALPDLLRMARENGITGIGLGNFSTGFTRYKSFPTRNFFNQAHFDLLQFPIETGIVGTTLLCLIVLYCGYQGLKTLFQCHSRLLKGTGFAVTMSLSASLLHAWVDYNLQIPATASLFVVMLALGLIPLSLPDKQKHTVSQPIPETNPSA